MEESDPDVCLLASQYSLIDHANALKQAPGMCGLGCGL
jgi:hypothetical protein